MRHQSPRKSWRAPSITIALGSVLVMISGCFDIDNDNVCTPTCHVDGESAFKAAFLTCIESGQNANECLPSGRDDRPSTEGCYGVLTIEDEGFDRFLVQPDVVLPFEDCGSAQCTSDGGVCGVSEAEFFRDAARCVRDSDCNVCQGSSCDLRLGKCTQTTGPAPTGTPCPDMNDCTLDQTCDGAGRCIVGGTKACPENSVCVPGTVDAGFPLQEGGVCRCAEGRTLQNDQCVCVDGAVENSETGICGPATSPENAATNDDSGGAEAGAGSQSTDNASTTAGVEASGGSSEIGTQGAGGAQGGGDSQSAATGASGSGGETPGGEQSRDGDVSGGSDENTISAHPGGALSGGNAGEQSDDDSVDAISSCGEAVLAYRLPGQVEDTPVTTTNCFQGDANSGPCETCGFNADLGFLELPGHCLTCTDGYVISDHDTDCTGFCRPIANARNPVTRSTCQAPTELDCLYPRGSGNGDGCLDARQILRLPFDTFITTTGMPSNAAGICTLEIFGTAQASPVGATIGEDVGSDYFFTFTTPTRDVESENSRQYVFNFRPAMPDVESASSYPSVLLVIENNAETGVGCGPGTAPDCTSPGNCPQFDATTCRGTYAFEPYETELSDGKTYTFILDSEQSPGFEHGGMRISLELHPCETHSCDGGATCALTTTYPDDPEALPVLGAECQGGEEPPIGGEQPSTGGEQPSTGGN